MQPTEGFASATENGMGDRQALNAFGDAFLQPKMSQIQFQGLFPYQRGLIAPTAQFVVDFIQLSDFGPMMIDGGSGDILPAIQPAPLAGISTSLVDPG